MKPQIKKKKWLKFVNTSKLTIYLLGDDIVNTLIGLSRQSDKELVDIAGRVHHLRFEKVIA
jgi:surface polysaccharide O-acyltransferase-like enzyme